MTGMIRAGDLDDTIPLGGASGIDGLSAGQGARRTPPVGMPA